MAIAASSNVPPQSNLYDKLEKLRAFGLIDTYVTGIKPISRLEFARQLKEAIINRNKNVSDNFSLIDEILVELKNEFSQELDKGKDKIRNRFLNSASIETIFLRQNPTPHLETIAQNKTLASNRSGQNLSDGINTVLSSNGWIDFYDNVSIYLEPRMVTRQKGDKFDFDMAKGYMKFGIKNIELELGRDDVMYGFGYSGQMQMSNNALGLTMAKLSTPRPFYFPWIFKYMGQARWEFIFSMMEEDRQNPSATFWAMAFMFRPSKYFEYGFSRTTFLGGQNVGDYSWHEYFFEAAVGIRTYNIDTKNIGNNSYGFYAQFTIPALRNTKIYFDGFFEDIGWKIFTRDLSFLTGIDIPRLTDDSKLSLKIEFLKTTEITYRTRLYPDGYTHSGDLIGHHLGPDAFASYSKLTYTPKSSTALKLDFNFERHGRTGLTQESVPLRPDIFEKAENRYAFIFGIEQNITANFLIKSSVGYERIQNYSFKDNSSKNNFLGNASFITRF